MSTCWNIHYSITLPPQTTGVSEAPSEDQKLRLEVGSYLPHYSPRAFLHGSRKAGHELGDLLEGC